MFKFFSKTLGMKNMFGKLFIFHPPKCSILFIKKYPLITKFFFFFFTKITINKKKHKKLGYNFILQSEKNGVSSYKFKKIETE